MPYDPERHHRRSIRRHGYDYAAAGVYFVTICTQGRELFFEEEGMRAAAERCWLAIPGHVAGVELDEWIVMPNHLHGLIVIGDREDDRLEENRRQGQPGVHAGNDQAGVSRPGVQLNAPTDRRPRRSVEVRRGQTFPQASPARNTLGVTIRTYKAAVTTECRRLNYLGFGWQRGYHDRIIRNDRELDAIRHYIIENPRHWASDEHHLGRS